MDRHKKYFHHKGTKITKKKTGIIGILESIATMNDDLKEKISTILFASFFVSMSMLPLFLMSFHESKLADEGTVSIVGNGELFVYPQECWLNTPLGITVSSLIFVLLMSVCFICARKYRDPLFILLFVPITIGGTLLIQMGGRSVFDEHKGDHILLGRNKIEYKYEDFFASIRYSDIKYMIFKDRGFIIRHKDYRERDIRIKNMMVAKKLCGNKLLQKRFEELLKKYPKQTRN